MASSIINIKSIEAMIMNDTPNDARISQLYQNLVKQQVNPTIEQHILQVAAQQASLNRQNKTQKTLFWQKLTELFVSHWQQSLVFTSVFVLVCGIVLHNTRPSDNIYQPKGINPPTEAELQAQTWAELRALISQKKYDEAREQLNNLRQRNPQIVVPEDIIQALDTPTTTP